MKGLSSSSSAQSDPPDWNIRRLGDVGSVDIEKFKGHLTDAGYARQSVNKALRHVYELRDHFERRTA